MARAKRFCGVNPEMIVKIEEEPEYDNPLRCYPPLVIQLGGTLVFANYVYRMWAIENNIDLAYETALQKRHPH